MNCQDPTATPSVMLPAVATKVVAKLRTSPTFHSGGAASGSFTWQMTSVFSGLRSAWTQALATSKF